MNALDRKFGIEIEVVCSSRHSNRSAHTVMESLKNYYSCVVHSYNTHGLRHWELIGTGWTVCFDGSVSYGGEVKTTDPLTIREGGLEKVEQLLKDLKLLGFKVNINCGIHIHVDGSDYKRSDMKKFLRLFLRIRKVFYMLVNRDREDNRYCRKLIPSEIKKLINAHTPQKIKEAWYQLYGSRSQTSHWNGSRYYEVNLHAFWLNARVEFRMFNSTLQSPRLVASWIVLCISSLQYAKDCRIIRTVEEETNHQRIMVAIRSIKESGLNMKYGVRLGKRVIKSVWDREDRSDNFILENIKGLWRNNEN